MTSALTSAVEIVFLVLLGTFLLVRAYQGFRVWRDARRTTRSPDGGQPLEVVMPTSNTFDLAAAKTGAKVVRRDGADEVVEVIEHLSLPDNEKPVRVIFRRPDGTVYSGKRHRNGKRDLRKDSQGDLLMYVPAQKFLNLWRDGSWDQYDTEREAREAAANEAVHVALPVTL